jgi:hypothetical protein
MNAKKCDRCGALYDPKVSWEYSVIKDCPPYPEQRIDLCHNCMYELEKWLQEGGAK